jgi:hypothetical protein
MNESDLICFGNPAGKGRFDDHKLMVIRTERNATDQTRTRIYCTVQEFMCEKCFKTLRLSEIEEFIKTQKSKEVDASYVSG